MFQSREVASAVATILTSGGNGTSWHALVGTLTSHALQGGRLILPTLPTLTFNLVMDTHIICVNALRIVPPVLSVLPVSPILAVIRALVIGYF